MARPRQADQLSANDPVDHSDPTGENCVGEGPCSAQDSAALTQSVLKTEHEHPTATAIVAGVAVVGMTGGTALAVAPEAGAAGALAVSTARITVRITVPGAKTTMCDGTYRSVGHCVGTFLASRDCAAL